jgi:DUF917 family protein
VRLVGEEQLENITLGAGILGTGGGGNPYIGKLLAREAIRAHGKVEVVELDEVPDDALVVPTAMIGAPTVRDEKLPRGDEVVRAVEQLQRYLGGTATHTMSIEIGGRNSVIPLCLASNLRLPVVDADLMGRAFPELQMCLPSLYGLGTSPMAIADEKGNTSIINGRDNLWTERLARSHTVEMGCAAVIALYPMTGAQLRDCTVPRSLRTAEQLGLLIGQARENHDDPISATIERLNGRRLFTGKVIDVHRRTEGGFARAEARIEGLDADAGGELQLHTQNEHLVAQRGAIVLASVPDLIIVLDSETGQPITTEELRYGFRVSVLAAPCDPRWRTDAGLAIVGPRYFGYDFDYQPIEQGAKQEVP